MSGGQVGRPRQAQLFGLVSALATRGLCTDVLRRVVAKHHLIVSETVLRELRRVLRDKFRVPNDTIEAADRFLRREAVAIGQAPSPGIDLRDGAMFQSLRGRWLEGRMPS